MMKDKILTAHDFGNLIRTARKKQGLSQEDLAGLADVGRRFISDLENGKETVQLGKSLKVMRSLGIKLSVTMAWAMHMDKDEKG